MTDTVELSGLPNGQLIGPSSGQIDIQGANISESVFNGPIGGDTPASGAFTTISASSNITARGDVIFDSSNKSFKGDTIINHYYNFQVYDVDGAAYLTLMRLVNGNVPRLEIGGEPAAQITIDTVEIDNSPIGQFAPSTGGFTDVIVDTITGNFFGKVATDTITLKQGANGKTGTVTLNGATPVTITNSSITANSGIIFTLKTVGGTVGAYPAIQTITPTTGCTVAGSALDTSTYNYHILESAA